MSKFDENIVAKEIAQQIAQEVAQQIAKQVGQEIAQQQAKQIEQAVAQGIQAEKQGIQGSTQEKSSSFVNKEEEILGGEALRAGVVSATRLWNANDKYIFEKSQDYDRAMKSLELKEKQLAVAEREAKLRKQASLDAIEISEREQSSLVKHMLNTWTVDFRTAAADPFAPNAANPDERD